MMDKGFESAFSKAFEEFIINMEKLPPDVTHPAINGCVAPTCEILRIAELKVSLFTPPKGGPDSQPEIHSVTYFSDGEADGDRPYAIKKATGDGGNAEYLVCPRKGESDWSELEKSKIDLFMITLFVFNGRARAMNIAENFVFMDTDLKVHNLNYFYRFCGELMAKKQIYGYTCCRFNIKRFSIVNRRFGRNGGTDIMKKYIDSLSEITGESGIVCRIGGDNFIALFPNEKTDAVMDYLQAVSIDAEPNGTEKINISSRAGYCPVTDDIHSVTEIMDRVSSAESIANNNNSMSYAFYDEKTRHKNENAKWVEGLFEDAIRNEEFLVYYQPKVDLKDYSLAGAEALCRWKHNGEIIPPFRFIPVFEQSNNICVLDFYMLEHICRHIRQWLDNGLPVVKVSVNMSRVHLSSEDLAARIIEIIRKYDIPNEYIEIELTETTTDVDSAELKRVVNALRDEGIGTSVDDFGVGYSSLNLIRELPWNVLKIDKSFLPDDIDENSEQKKIMLKYVIAMAQNLGLECIVEGVETIDQVALLKENGCFRAQGFYFDRPLPVDKFEERLVNSSRTGAVTLKNNSSASRSHSDLDLFETIF